MSHQTRPRARSSARGFFLTASAFVLSVAATGAANALPVRDDVGPDAAVDTANQWAGVGQMYNLQPAPFVGLCTGQLINPRAVVFAAHCVDAVADEAYGALTGGIGVAFAFNPENAFSADALAWINSGYQSQPQYNLFNVLQVQTVLNQPGGAFPLGDVAMASFSTHIDHLPTYGMLFSPLEGPEHATLVGYGRTGTGSEGDVLGIDFKRRVGENMVDGLFSSNDFLAGVFAVPGLDFGDEASAQLLYHIDFDRPDRNPNDCVRGEFFGFGFGNDIVCNTPPFGDAITWDLTSAIEVGDHIDWYPGDALPFEAGTAGGDSGSGLFLDQIYERPLIAGVLSGGWVPGIFSPNGGYGDVSYYNPLFLFRDWIQENNPYVYASAKAGNGKWSDPKHWVQDMDPNYFYIDSQGKVKNGVPSEPEPGLFADRPKWGTVFDLDIPDDIEGETGASPSSLAASDLGFSPMDMSAKIEAPHLATGPSGLSVRRGTSPSASKGAPTGPGSTGFVPNNDWGTYGSWTGPNDGVARFYDVTLSRPGVTTVDMNAEIDRLTVSGLLTGLHVKPGYQLNALIAVDQHLGFVEVDGGLAAREYALWGGVLTGNGQITTETLYNVNGVLSAGSLTGVGALTINGDYVQTSEGNLVVNIRRQGRNVLSDFVQVNGAASLAGNAIVAPVNVQSLPRWRDVYTVMNADEVSGDFDDVHLLLTLPLLYGDSVVRPNGDVDIVVEARRITDILGSGHVFQSLGEALDSLRWNGGYESLQPVFARIDSAGFESFENALFSLTPQSAFTQAGLVFGFNSSFTGHLAARSAELRAGARGLSFAGLRGAFAEAAREGLAPAQGASALTSRPGAPGAADRDNRLGVFVSSRRFYNAAASELHPGWNSGLGSFDPLHPASSFDAFADSGTSYGDLAIGADYRLTPTMAVGVSFATSQLDLASTLNAPVSNENTGLAAYATKYGRNWYVDGYYGVARHSFELARPAAAADLAGFMDGTANALGAPESTQSIAGIRGGFAFDIAKGLTVGPMAALNYSNSRFESYREYSGGDFNLLVDERELTSLSMTTGATLAFTQQTPSGKLFSLFGELAMAQELGDRSEFVTAAFAAAPDARFTMERALDDSWYTASAGLSYAVSTRMSAALQFGADFDRGPLSQHYATMNLAWRF